MKKFIILGALFFGIMVFAGCSHKQVTQIQPTIPKDVEKQAQVVELNQDIVYKNQTYGFTLTFPQSWYGFKAAEQTYDAYSSVCFSFKQPQPFCIFQIVKLNNSQWEQVKNKENKSILSKTDDSIILCDGCCKYGDDTTGGGQFNQFQIDRCKEVPNIIKTFAKTVQVANKMSVLVSFPNNQLDPNMLDCKKVFMTARTIDETLGVGKAALEELFKGPTDQEKKDGYFTNIPTGVKIQKLTIENGVAKVDLSKELEQGVGGSCRVDSIRAQITQTLKQFATVQNVIISIDGKTEDILQP